jgi:hypothetical protein
VVLVYGGVFSQPPQMDDGILIPLVCWQRRILLIRLSPSNSDRNFAIEARP